jgi:hypothetical protein
MATESAMLSCSSSCDLTIDIIVRYNKSADRKQDIKGNQTHDTVFNVSEPGQHEGGEYLPGNLLVARNKDLHALEVLKQVEELRIGNCV